MRNKWNDTPYVILWIISFIVMLFMVFSCSEDKVVGDKIKQDTVIFTVDTEQVDDIFYINKFYDKNKDEAGIFSQNEEIICPIGSEGYSLDTIN